MFLYILSSVVLFEILKFASFRKLNPKESTIFALRDTAFFSLYILAQQISFYLLWLFLTRDILILALLFCVIHLPLLFKYRKFDAILLIISSFFGGLIFCTLLNNFYFGFVYSYITHLGYYVFLDFLYFAIKRKPIKKNML